MARAAQYDRTGGPEVLEIVEILTVEPGPGKVRLQVRAAGLNPYDAKVRSGVIPSQAAFPRRIGSDVAGTVLAVGEDAVYADGTPVQLGDEVFGSAAGSAAEVAVAQAKNIAPRPEGLPVEVAGSLNVAGLTAMSVRATVPTGEGDTVLVGGAAGAVGFVAAQLAVAAGATVIGTASERNHDLLRSVGVVPVAYGHGLADRVRAAGAVTAVYDCHGRDALDAGIELGVGPDRMVAIAAYDAIDELGVHNVERAARTPENLRRLGERIAVGELVFPVAQTFPLDEIVAAFEAIESSHPVGKIVVLP